MPRLKLTLTSIAKHCRSPGPDDKSSSGEPKKQLLYWDEELPGFGLAVGLKAKTFVIQRALRDGRIRRIVIGRLDPWTPEAARKRAREMMVDIDRGIDPIAERKREEDRGVTLEQALEAHLARLKARGGSDVTAQDMRDRFDRHLRAWLNRPLADLTRLECRAHHRSLSEKPGPGPYLANCVFRYLRAVYNTALKVHDLPGVNPTIAVDWNKMRRRQEPIPWAELPAWRARIERLPALQRDYQLLVLLTGLRSSDAASLRWEHLDLEGGTMHRPRPKGGEDRAFTVPIAQAVVDLLKRRREENLVTFFEAGGDGGWVFPSYTRKAKTQPLVWRRAARRRDADRGGPGRSPHRLRDTFATACVEAGVDWLVIKVLLNHAPPSGDVTAGYVRPSLEGLRPSVERVAGFLQGKMATASPPNEAVL